ncbi:MAG: hypothetical protein QW304_07935 [Thermoproteota archaeon]
MISKKWLLVKSIVYRFFVILFELLVAYITTGTFSPLKGFFNQAVILIAIINSVKVLGLWAVDMWWFHWGKPLLKYFKRKYLSKTG